jgi:hypothetical protein
MFNKPNISNSIARKLGARKYIFKNKERKNYHIWLARVALSRTLLEFNGLVWSLNLNFEEPLSPWNLRFKTAIARTEMFLSIHTLTHTHKYTTIVTTLDFLFFSIDGQGSFQNFQFDLISPHARAEGIKNINENIIAFIKSDKNHSHQHKFSLLLSHTHPPHKHTQPSPSFPKKRKTKN